MKQLMIRGVRAVHRVMSRGPLPARLAIYFHALEAPDYGAFRECFEDLLARGYVASTPEAFLSGSERALFISFDDNYASWHRCLPFLDDLGVKATFYVNTLPMRGKCHAATLARYFDRIAHVGERVPLSAAEICEMRSAGHTIGCHSHSHFVLSQLPRGEWDAEIRRSKELLEDLLGEAVPHFSYPYGMRRFFTRALADYCYSIGFQSIASGIPGLQMAPLARGPLLHRTRWNLDRPLAHNIADLEIDGRLFESLTGRSAVG